MPISKWRGPEVEAKVKAITVDGLTRAAEHFNNQVRKNIGKPSPWRKKGPRTVYTYKGGRYVKGSKVAGKPKLDGHPMPGKITGALQRSVTYAVDTWKLRARAGYGINAPYGKWLEFGTSRTPPHPALRVTLRREAKALFRIFTRGRKL